MEKMVARSILAMLVCVAMTACGTSKDNGAPVHIGTNAKTNSQHQNKADAQTQGQAKADAQTAETGRQPMTTQKVDGSGDSSKTQKTTKKSGTQQKKESTTSTPKIVSAPTDTSSSNQSSGSKSSKSRSSSHKQKSNPVQTSDDLSQGTINRLKAEADRYTGSADDYLRNFLMVKEARLSDLQKGRNLQTANSVRSASLKVDYKADDGGGSGDVALTLNIAQGGESRALVLGGTIDNGRARIRSSASNVAVEGEVICMDADATMCETAVADLVVGTSSSKKATLRIIFRRTDVNLQANFPNRNCHTQECEDLYTMFSETGAYQRGNLTSPDRLIIKKAKLETFEVINGRSGFRLTMSTIGGEMLTFGGPLYTQSLMSSAAVSVRADRSINVEDQVNFVTGQNYKTRLNSTMQDIRVVGNDGLGVITVDVKAGVAKPGVEQDHFTLVIQRLSKPLRPIVGMSLADN
jgi:hypothetical protein